MIRLKQLCTVIVITLALSVTALAGDMDTPGVIPKPPCEPAMTSGTSTPVQPASGINGTGITVDSALLITQHLFNSMMMYSIF